MTKAPVRAAVARLAVVGLWLLATPGVASGHAQTWPSESPTSAPAVLAVPYLPQSVLLCGGAALAMVERWWGRRGVQAVDFASLVRPEQGGIRTDDLDSAARDRGWDTRAIRGAPALIQQLLREGVPVIALIEVGRDRYHYVVVLGWGDGRVVFHDPAGAPSTSLAEARFLSRWAGADHWALIVQPTTTAPSARGGVPVTATATVPEAATDPMPCAPWLDQALDAVAANQLDAAARLLDEAGRACPDEPLVQRELAAVRYRQGRQAEASQLAGDYLARAPGDELGWQLLATSRYLAGDYAAALEAWNTIDRPIVDLVVITGSRAVRFQQLAAAVSVPHGTVLTPSRLALAERRLADMPALRRARVTYQPVAGGLVEVRAAVVERPIMDPPWRLAVSGAIGALAHEAVHLEVASPTGAGELWSAEWRWEAARPRASVGAEVPTHLGVPGVLGVEGAWERMRVASDTAGAPVVGDTWRSAAIGFRGWVTRGLLPSATLGLERWSGDRRYLTIAAGTELRALDDRLRVTATGVQAAALSEHPSYQRGGVEVMWASSLGLSRAAWSARLGGDWASESAPVGVWPLAGGDPSRAIPLRAEPFPRDVVAPRVLGRTILHGGLAGDVPLYRVGPLVLAAGAFLDGARIAASADESVGGRLYVDVGVGLRIGIADGELGVLRIDVARGLLEDGRSALTLGVHR
ncbi:MAG TPA: papain-like cysteine protease family protein [Longimicrobiales bacterium]|nr:papain-like cysteine protease family protein [Longimicrobiales bacterium]